jgi:tetratricopeptide (TPR) repeat protein
MRKLVAVLGISAGFALAFAATPAQAQYREPQCDLSTGHFLVNSGVVYIKGAAESADMVKKERMLRDAHRNLMEAIDRRGQGDNAAAWYFLGRYYAASRDPIGADSAFDRAESLAPDCAEDISFFRRNLWVMLLNVAIDSMQNGSPDGALGALREANTIYDDDIIGFYYVGSVFGQAGELDSALHYFKMVAVMGTDDPERQESYQVAVFNSALINGMLEQWDSSAVWWERYLELMPGDAPALTSLAEAYDQAGNTDRAMAVYDTIMARAEEMDYLQLFLVGEKLFIAQHFEQSARAFELGLEKNPHYRPALYNLTNSYLAIADADGISPEEKQQWAETMEATALRLVEVDPYNAGSLRLLAAAHQLQRDENATLAVLQEIDVMAFEVEMGALQPLDGGLSVQGQVLNLDEAETAVPAITFEFVDAAGNVLATEIINGRTLGAGESYDFELLGAGEGIIAVRYRVGE